MKLYQRIASLSMAAVLLLGSAQAAGKKAKTTPTPPPEAVTETVIQDVPKPIQDLLDLAYKEWEELGGKTLKRSNKYTKWRNNYEWGWCGGFLTWCMLQLDVPMERLEERKKIGEGEEPGIRHIMEASVGKLLRGYQLMHRSTDVPQKGFLVVYGVRKSANKTVHIGLVWDVEDLGGGKYRLTTIEGNMNNTVRMYVHDYDRFAEDREKNLTAPPEEARTRDEDRTFSYKVPTSSKKPYYINCFLMPWVPEGTEGTGAVDAAVTPPPEVSP